jgi:hypothetical protein
MASSDMRELKAHIMQVCIHSASLDCCARHALSPLASLFCSVQLPNDMCSRAVRKPPRAHHWEVAVKRLKLSMAGGTDVDVHWALSCLALMSFDSAAEFQVIEAPSVSDAVCVLMRSALNHLVVEKARSTQRLHVTEVPPVPIFALNSASQKASVTATAICDVCSIIIHNLSLLPANHIPLSGLQCTIALLNACANAQLCPAVALRSANVLVALTRAGALNTMDPVRWARAIEGLVAYSVGRAVAGHGDPDVLDFSFTSEHAAVVCVGFAASTQTDLTDLAAAALNLIIVASTSGFFCSDLLAPVAYTTCFPQPPLPL